jgi:hypothetical protein
MTSIISMQTAGTQSSHGLALAPQATNTATLAAAVATPVSPVTARLSLLSALCLPSALFGSFFDNIPVLPKGANVILRLLDNFAKICLNAGFPINHPGLCFCLLQAKMSADVLGIDTLLVDKMTDVLDVTLGTASAL